jgi:hypothetical protein
MGRKVFVSYKYGDTQVKPLRGIVERPTQVRDYVNYLENAFLEIDELYWYAERDDESLAGLYLLMLISNQVLIAAC